MSHREETIHNGRSSPFGARTTSPTPFAGRSSPSPYHQQPHSHLAQEIPRSQSAFSDAPTLVRSRSNSSLNDRSGTQKTSPQKPKGGQRSASHTIPSGGGPSNPEQPMIRSIFPRFNPDLPLDRQQYYPTPNAASPTTVPQSAISRNEYSNSPINGRVPSIRSPLSAPATQSSFPRGVLDIPKTAEPSSSEELKQLWKVTNGWRVSASEGRTFCLKMESSVDSPIHTLSSADGGTFYHIRLDPTSTSAIMTITRCDPNKASSPSSSSANILKGPMLGGKSKESNGLEVLTTTLSEPSRRHSPNDGLVALLCPKAAAEVALSMAAKSTSEEGLQAAADFEVGRLVWDDDTSKYYLSHPSLTTPFCIAVKEYKAWSKVEYSLEHPLMPFNLVKLTRDGAGGGSLEIDTGVASRIESYYLVDVAVAAILIAALEEEKKHNIERFEAPPPVPTKTSPKSAPKLSSIFDGKLGAKDTKKVKIQEMEVDLESQSSIKKEGSDLPKPTKGVLKLLYWAFKFVVWCLTITVKATAAIIIGLSKCLTRKGLN